MIPSFVVSGPVHTCPFIALFKTHGRSKFSVYVGIVGIKVKSVSEMTGYFPVHLIFLKTIRVFFGPVHGKSPQSAKLAHDRGGSAKKVNASLSQFWNSRSSKCWRVM